MGKFTEMLTSSSADIISARARIISESSLEASEELVRGLKKEKRELEIKLIGLTDISPNSTLSLTVVKDGFDPLKLFKEIQDLKVKIANKTIEIQLAEETHKEWFGDNKEEEK